MVVGASRGESLEIACRVEADPPARSFRWKFNNSGETVEVPAMRFSVGDGLSVLKYTPSTELDYGTLSCWADNQVGSQSKPCLFQLVAAGKYLVSASTKRNEIAFSCRGAFKISTPTLDNLLLLRLIEFPRGNSAPPLALPGIDSRNRVDARRVVLDIRMKM